MIHTVEVSDRLVFGQAVRHNQKLIKVSQTFSMSSTVGENQPRGSATQVLPFNEDVDYSLSTTRHVTQTLEFTQDARRAHVQWIHQGLLFAQTVSFGYGFYVDQNLTFTQTTSIQKNNAANNLLTFTQTTSINVNRVMTTAQGLSFQHFAYLEKQVGAAPSVSKTCTLGGLTLPAPDFGNAETLGQTRIQRETRGGTLIIAKPAGWPTSREFSMTFSYLSQELAYSLRNVIRPGYVLTYTDHEGASWQIIVTSPEATITQVGRYNFQVSLTFMVYDA